MNPESDQVTRARRIQETMSSPGWRDIEAIARQRIEDARDSLISIMSLRPEELTEGRSFTLAARQKELSDFLEVLRDEVRINVQQEKPTTQVRAGNW